MSTAACDQGCRRGKGIGSHYGPICLVSRSQLEPVSVGARVEFVLEEIVTVKLSETIGPRSVNEVLALLLGLGKKQFAAGPMMILVKMIAKCSLEHLFSYLVMARGDMKGLLTFAEILKKKDAQGHPEQLEAMKLSLWHWFY